MQRATAQAIDPSREACLDESVRMVIEGAADVQAIAPAAPSRPFRPTPHRTAPLPADRAVKRTPHAPAGFAAARTAVGLAAISGGMAR